MKATNDNHRPASQAFRSFLAHNPHIARQWGRANLKWLAARLGGLL